MNAPPPPHPRPPPRDAAATLQIRRLLELRDEMSQLHARLVYLQLMLKLGAAR